MVVHFDHLTKTIHDAMPSPVAVITDTRSFPDEDLRSELSEGFSQSGLRGFTVLASILQGKILTSKAVSLDAMPSTPSQAPQGGE